MSARKDAPESETNAEEAVLERLRFNGVVDIYFSRHDYHERLDQYIDRARRRIDVVTTTFRLASADGDLLAVLRQKLALKDFEVCISLLNPQSAAAEVLSAEAGQSPTDFRESVKCAAGMLLQLRNSLSGDQQSRFRLLEHSVLPFASAYLIDANLSSGMIHVEARLFAAPKKESFGYRIVGPSEFYQRNYQAWMAIIGASSPL